MQPFAVAKRKACTGFEPLTSAIPVQRTGVSQFVYRRGQGFESCTSLNFFSGFLFATAKVASITAMIYFHVILHPAFHIYDFHIFITSLFNLLAPFVLP